MEKYIFIEIMNIRWWKYISIKGIYFALMCTSVSISASSSLLSLPSSLQIVLCVGDMIPRNADLHQHSTDFMHADMSICLAAEITGEWPHRKRG